jgi:nuclear GTP-binding protein
MAKKEDNPRNILIKKRHLPMSLLSDPVRENKVRLLDVETYEETFGPKSRRKRIKLQVNSLEEMAEKIEEKQQAYEPEKDMDIEREEADEKDENRDKRMSAGQSKRIWEELYKVLDSSDVLVQILDARDPDGTRSRILE